MFFFIQKTLFLSLFTSLSLIQLTEARVIAVKPKFPFHSHSRVAKNHLNPFSHVHHKSYKQQIQVYDRIENILSSKNNVESLVFLKDYVLNHGINLNVQLGSQRKPLIFSVIQSKHPENLEFLLKNFSIDLSIINKKGQNILHILSKTYMKPKKYMEFSKLILNHLIPVGIKVEDIVAAQNSILSNTLPLSEQQKNIIEEHREVIEEMTKNAVKKNLEEFGITYQKVKNKPNFASRILLRISALFPKKKNQYFYLDKVNQKKFQDQEKASYFLQQFQVKNYLDIINQKDQLRNTPLHLAASQRKADLFAQLIHHGANPYILNKKNKTPAYSLRYYHFFFNSLVYHLKRLGVFSFSQLKNLLKVFFSPFGLNSKKLPEFKD